MTTNYINSDEVNSVPFPGAEEGTSLVQLVGEVQTTATISSITLRLLAAAAVVSTAQAGSIAPKVRFGVEPTTTATATVEATAQSKVHLYPDAQSGSATTSVAAICKRVTGGTGTAAATSTGPISKVVVKRGASGGPAAVGTATAVRKWARSASASGQAVAAATSAHLETLRSALTSGSAVCSVVVIERQRVGAAVAPQAAWFVDSLVQELTGATTIASAIVAPLSTASFDRVAATPVTAYATPASITLRMKIAVYPVQAAQAAPKPVASSAIYHLGAIGAATVSSAIAAADYSATLPAPIERTMVLSPILRRMEVTE